MSHILIPAFPISLLWVTVTGRVEWGSLLVGYVMSVITLIVLSALGIRFQGRFTLRQVVAIVRYSAILFWNGLVSSVHVALMLLRPKIELKTGIVALETGDHSPEQRIAALSAHGLNMTPGQLVIDFDDGGKLYVHCLDLEGSRPKLENDQRKRTQLLREIMGVSDE
jgi:multicomponent Na+:H+ antiporter subunit E